MNTDKLSPEQILTNANGGKLPSLTELVNYWVTSGTHGYDLLLKILFIITIIAAIIGVFLTIIGFITNSSHMKRWGLGSILGPFAMFGFAILVPVIVATIQAKIMPH